MAKAQAAAAGRFVTEVAPPPPVVPVTRRRGKVPRSLDTIAEDDSEQLAAYGPTSSSDHQGFAAAPPAKARERAGGFLTMSDLSRCFLDAHGQQQQAAPAAGRVAITS